MAQVPWTARVGPRDGDQDSLLWAVRRGAPPGRAGCPTSYERAAGQRRAASERLTPGDAKPRRPRSRRIRPCRAGRGEHGGSAGARNAERRPGAAAQDRRPSRRRAEQCDRGLLPTETIRRPEMTAGSPGRSSYASSAPGCAGARARDADATALGRPPHLAAEGCQMTQGSRHDRSACVGARPLDPVRRAAAGPQRAASARERAPSQVREAEHSAPATAAPRERCPAPEARSTGRGTRSDPPSDERRGGRRARGPRAPRSARPCRRLPPRRPQSPLRPRSIPGAPA
jgi:hypothetical protein